MRIFNNRYASIPPLGVRTQLHETEVMVATRRSLVPSTETPHNRRRYDELVFALEEDSSEDNLIGSQVEICLREPRVHRNMDIIQWWKLHEHPLPNLALMARDYLSVPATRYQFLSVYFYLNMN